jgi:hypothetical protein
MTIESHGNYGSRFQFNKRITSKTYDADIITGSGALNPVRIFKVQGNVYKLDGTNPTAEIRDSAGKVICPIPITTGWFAYEWDYPGAWTADSAVPADSYAVGPIRLFINTDGNCDVYLKVEAFEHAIR